MDNSTDHLAHLGDRRTADLDCCGYGWAPGQTGCTEPAATHFLVEQTAEPRFVAVTAACTAHTDETRRAYPVVGVHPFQPDCAGSAISWNFELGRSWCSQ